MHIVLTLLYSKAINIGLSQHFENGYKLESNFLIYLLHIHETQQYFYYTNIIKSCYENWFLKIKFKLFCLLTQFFGISNYKKQNFYQIELLKLFTKI